MNRQRQQSRDSRKAQVERDLVAVYIDAQQSRDSRKRFSSAQ